MTHLITSCGEIINRELVTEIINSKIVETDYHTYLLTDIQRVGKNTNVIFTIDSGDPVILTLN